METMTLAYNDGTQASVILTIDYNFNPNGINVQDHTILNWSKMYWMSISIVTSTYDNGTQLYSSYGFFGFEIVPGNGSNVTFGLGPGHTPTDYVWAPNNVTAGLSYASNSAIISNVTLSAAPYTYQGQSYNGTEATFDLALNSSISAGGSNQSSEPTVEIPTVLSFRVSHTIAQTSYKYGASLNWSRYKAFPTTTPLKTGTYYSLVESEDRVQMVRGSSDARHFFGNFSTDAGNKTATFVWGTQVIGTEDFTQNYTINGNSSNLNTTRTYLRNATVTNGVNSSTTFVIYSGFRYNISTGFAFDPTITAFSSLAPHSSTGLLDWSNDETLIISILAISAGGLGLAVWYVRHRKAR